MQSAAKNVYRDRVGFQKINTSIPIPNLIEIQKNSYERFLQMRVLPAEREDAGLQSVFKSVFPITDGTERVIVSQLHRSPGVFFSQPEKGLFAAQINPYRGSWVEFEYDSKNLLHVRIDRKRKFLASVFLRAMGLKTDAEIIKTFYKWDRIQVREGKLHWKASDNLLGLKLSRSILGPKDPHGKREELLHAGKKITPTVLEQVRKLQGQEGEVHQAGV